MCHKLHSLRLKDGDSAQEHTKDMTKLFDALSVAGETVSKEGRVVYLLASLPESYSVLVTANEDVSKLEVVTEHILHQERKLKDRCGASSTTENTVISCKTFRQKSISVTIVENWGIPRRIAEISKLRSQRKKKTKSRKAAATTVQENLVRAQESLLVTRCLCQVRMNGVPGSSTQGLRGTSVRTASQLPRYQLGDPFYVVLGDGQALMAIRRGEVVLEMVLPNGVSKLCTLHDVFYVPKLSYNLSIAKASRNDKTVKLTEFVCYVLDRRHQMIANRVYL